MWAKLLALRLCPLLLALVIWLALVFRPVLLELEVLLGMAFRRASLLARLPLPHLAVAWLGGEAIWIHRGCAVPMPVVDLWAVATSRLLLPQMS